MSDDDHAFLYGTHVFTSAELAEHDREVAEKAPLVRSLREFYDRGEGVSWRDLQVLLAMSEPNVVEPCVYAEEPQMVECPHWEPGRITRRKGCTACAAEGRSSGGAVT
jgi:hypothetical protein